jgi:hypothetical protein
MSRIMIMSTKTERALALVAIGAALLFSIH